MRQLKGLREFVLESAPARVLDLGCGEGHFLARLLQRAPELEITAIELTPAAADRCRMRLANFNAEILNMNLLGYLASEIGCASGPYDAAIAGDVLYYLTPEVVATQVAPALSVRLRKGGRLVVSYADVNEHGWTVDVFQPLFRLDKQVYIKPIQEPPPWPWVVAALVKEG